MVDLNTLIRELKLASAGTQPLTPRAGLDDDPRCWRAPAAVEFASLNGRSAHMPMFTFEVRSSEDAGNEWLGRLWVSEPTRSAAERRAIAWAKERGHTLGDPREAKALRTEAPDGYIFFGGEDETPDIQNHD